MQAVIRKVRVQIAPILCWRCGQGMKAVRGYLFDGVFIPLRSVSDRRQISALIADLRKRDAAITPFGSSYSKTAGGWYFAACCPHCEGICGDVFMTDEFFTETARCGFPSCGCNDPNTQCRIFEYHPLALRLGPEELEEIAQWPGCHQLLMRQRSAP